MNFFFYTVTYLVGAYKILHDEGQPIDNLVGHGRDKLCDISI